VRIIKLHKRWADRYTLMWLGFALLLLALLVLLAAIRQAVGLGIAGVHMIVKGIDPER
jgi:hypothetical protein